MRPVRLPLVVDPEQRLTATTQDGKLVNCTVEQVGREPIVRLRPGVTNRYTPVAGQGLGAYHWGTDMYSVNATQVYKNGAAFGSTIASSATPINYTFVQTRGATPRLVFQNSYHGYYTDGATLSQMDGVVANYPTNLVPGIAYLNGYICVMDANTLVWNSAIDDPTTWNASDYVGAEVAPGVGVYLANYINFVIAFKQWSVEFLYDAGNAVGSPLSPYPGSKISIGCAFAGSVAQIDGVVFMVAQSQAGGLFVAMIENMKPIPISTPAVSRFLEAYEYAADDVRAIAFREAGHTYYVITLGLATAGAPQITLVYDASTQLWSEWNVHGSTMWPYTGQTYDASGPVLQDSSTGRLDTCTSNSFQDHGAVNIDASIVTPIFDGGTTVFKFFDRLELIGDKFTGTCTPYVSDDDYQTWNALESIDMSQVRSQVTQLGASRRRAFRFDLSNAALFRIWTAEIDLRAGIR